MKSVEQLEAEIVRLEDMLSVVATGARNELSWIDGEFLKVIIARVRTRNAAKELENAQKELALLEEKHKPKVALIVEKKPEPKITTFVQWLEEEEFSTRVQNYLCCNFSEDATIVDLAVTFETSLPKGGNFGRKSLNKLKCVLGKRGLHFGMSREAAEAAELAYQQRKK